MQELKKISVIPQDDTSSQIPALAQWMTPMSMLDRAVSGGASIEVLEKLMGLQERYEANLARKAFDNALADAKAEIPIIKKNRTVDFENRDKSRTTYRHEDLAEVVRTAVPIMSAHGLSHRYRLRNKPGEPITVTCILSHRDGYFEENELSAGADTSGGKNAIQGIKSAVTYLERITLIASLGLASAEDDDGRAAAPTAETMDATAEPVPGSITEAQVDAITDLLESRDVSRVAFLQWAKQKRVIDIPAEHFDACVTAISNFKPKAK